MLERCRDTGVTDVVLTPHFYADKENPESFLSRRDLSFDNLNAHINKEDLSGNPAGFWPRMIPGAEVYYFPELAAMDGSLLRKLCIGDSPYILVELPAEPWGEEVYKTLESMIFNRRVIPILAHIDRYFPFIKNPEPIWELAGMGMLIQLNGGALDHFLIRRKALKWIDAGMVHMLASDCHDPVHRSPNMDKACKFLQDCRDSSVAGRLTGSDPWGILTKEIGSFRE